MATVNNDEPKTPLEEFRAEQRARLELGAARPGGEGAFNRLMLAMDPTGGVNDWIGEESKRGLTVGELKKALGVYIANLILPLALAAPRPVKNAEDILAASLRVIDENITPQSRDVVIAIDIETGRQTFATIEGLLTKGLPK